MSSASWAISTVGSRVAGSRSKVRNRCRPKTLITSSTEAGSTSIASSSLRGTRRRVSCGSLAEGDQAEEHLLDRAAPLAVQRFQDPLRAGRQGPDHTADLVVCRQGELILGPVLEQLGEGVLKQRQRAGFVGHVGDHLGEQARLGRNADPLGRTPDCLLQLVRRER